MAECKSCKAPIVWAVARSTGRRMPVDQEPVALGNITLDYSGMLPAADVLAGSKLATARHEGKELRLNHFVTCPDRADWNKTPVEAGTEKA